MALRDSHIMLLQLLVQISAPISLLLLIERIYLAITVTLIKIFSITPKNQYKFLPIISKDVKIGTTDYPIVLVQIPMYNEREVYKLSIQAACKLSWPLNRLIIQVLDDSTDPAIKKMVARECERWANEGINIKYKARVNRNGYKAGALKEGLDCNYAKECDYVAIFDADFQPEHDFLWRTVPYLLHNPQVGLVQARLTFVNADECMMTRLQEISLDYHFKVEQEVGSATLAFFGFNGTAGVWRISAIADAGGWKDRTTVEDMDLTVRAALKGWKFVFLGDVKVGNELPSNFKAYRDQQHRWWCGSAVLFKKVWMEIIRNERLTFWKKIYIIYFFLLRKLIKHLMTFCFYCVVLPATVLAPEVVVPKWASCYAPTVIALLGVATLRSEHLLGFWILFENVMSLHRTKAILIGFFEAERVNEWIVTQKLGDVLKKKLGNKSTQKSTFTKIKSRLNALELVMSGYLLLCGAYGFTHGNIIYSGYLFVQAMAFFLAGISYIGIVV